jgi:ProP effector
VKWARVFSPSAPLPLAIGVREAIAEAAGDRFAADKIGWFLRWWTSRTEYLQAIARGGQRYYLDGSPAGEISEEHHVDASKELEARQARAALSEAAD